MKRIIYLFSNVGRILNPPIYCCPDFNCVSCRQLLSIVFGGFCSREWPVCTVEGITASPPLRGVVNSWFWVVGRLFPVNFSHLKNTQESKGYTTIIHIRTYIYERMYLCNINILTTRTKKFTFQVHQRDTEKGREKEYESDNRGGYL